MPRPTGYTRTQIRLHWITVLLVALQYLLHDGISDAYDVARDTGVYQLAQPVAMHALGGLLILLLAVWRMLLRKDHGVPDAPAAEPEPFRTISHWAHLAFYGLLVLLPITGAMAWGGQMVVAGAAHEVLKTLLLLLIVAHVGAVVLHQVVWKTNVIERMKRPG